jgi:hypothetical protein
MLFILSCLLNFAVLSTTVQNTNTRQLKYSTTGKNVCNFDPTPAAVVKKLTRHKGQTVRDLSPAEIIEYSPEFGIGVKIVGIKVNLFNILGSINCTCSCLLVHTVLQSTVASILGLNSNLLKVKYSTIDMNLK